MTEMAKSLNLVYEDLLKYFASMMTQYRKLKHKKPGQGTTDKMLTHHQKWILNHYAFIGQHIDHHHSEEAAWQSKFLFKIMMQYLIFIVWIIIYNIFNTCLT